MPILPPRLAVSASRRSLFGGGLEKAALPAQAVGVTFEPDQLLDVLGGLDAGRLVEAARMTGDGVGAVEDAHLLQCRDHGDGAPRMGMRDAIVIEVEPGVGGLADPDFDPLVDGRPVVGQRHQGAALALEGLAHAQGAVRRGPGGRPSARRRWPGPGARALAG